MSEQTFGSQQWKQLPHLKTCVRVLQNVGLEAMENNDKDGAMGYLRLAAKLNTFNLDPTFKRARHLWLQFYALSLPPPREIEAVLYAQLRSDDAAWDWHYPVGAHSPIGNLFETLELEDRVREHDARLEEIRRELEAEREQDWKAEADRCENLGIMLRPYVPKKVKKPKKVKRKEVFEEIARQDAEAGKTSVSGDAVRKEYERLRRKLM